MPGGIGIAIILLVAFPVAVIMSCCAIAWLLGTLLTKDGQERYEGSELVELNA